MTPEEKKQLKARGQQLSPITSIGKNGISDNTIMQIKNHLKANKLTKVKILKTFLDESGASKKDLAQQLADACKAELIQLVGFTVVLYKR